MENQKVDILKNHSCLAFKFCETCRKKYCSICENDVHSCETRCSGCNTNGLNDTYNCENCSKQLCKHCCREPGDCSKKYCSECFLNHVYLKYKYIKYLYTRYEVDDLCFICKKQAAFECCCGEKFLCVKCYATTNYCENACGIAYCPVMKDFGSKHRCSECYNVFADRHPLMKKRLMTTLLCLKNLQLVRMPTPLRLLICSNLN